MESVLAGFITFFVTLFAALTLSTAVVTTQDSIRGSWQDMEARQNEQSRTALTPVYARVTLSGTMIEFTLRNTGTTRLTDFAQWDVFLQYYDVSTPAHYHVGRLTYTAQALQNDQWTVLGIYLDAHQGSPAPYEPTIINPGEEAIFQIKVMSPVAQGTSVRAVFGTPNGITAATFVSRDGAPTLTVNKGIRVNVVGSAVINSAHLIAVDAGNLASALSYNVTIPPSKGTLSLGTKFNQDDINNGLLIYTHTDGSNTADSFQFTVTNEEATVGPFTFTIGVNAPPVLVVNSRPTTAGSEMVISNGMLQTTDADDAVTSIIYTITSAPTLGTLNIGPIFTQADIDSGALKYTPTGSGDDTFAFTISDGKATSGPYTFNITNP